MVVSVWRLVKTLRLLRVVSAYAWCHFELRFLRLSSPLRSRIRVGAELHLFFDSVFYIAELL
jgi:hypothetical protein